MKFIPKLLISIYTFLFFISFAQAQTKEDIIYLLDGTQKKGKVIVIGDNIVKFSYTGEEVQYELSKSSVERIVFANGREEGFNNSALSSGKAAASVNLEVNRANRNQLAILPFELMTNEQGLRTDAMRREVQQSCVEALQSRGLSFQIQDQRTTNALLTKAGIAFADIANHTPDELAKVLGVDYVVLGAYDIENKGTMNYGSSVGTYNNKKQDNKAKGSIIQSNSSYTSTNYDTKVQLSIYDAHGRQLFSDTRKPFLGGLDSYKGALKTLVKRIPLK